jgi:hypothetical protein
MPAFPRAELEEMVNRFLEANRVAEQKKDWSKIGQFYTDDAIYGWTIGPDDEVIIVGAAEIQRIVMGLEMDGLDEDEWIYPYQRMIIDEVQGEVVGFYRYIAGKRRADGSLYESAGHAGSWFHYAGNFKWSWQRDFFDWGNLAALYEEMHKDGVLGPKLTRRMEKIRADRLIGKLPPGHFFRGEAPIQQWDLAPGTTPLVPIEPVRPHKNRRLTR